MIFSFKGGKDDDLHLLLLNMSLKTIGLTCLDAHLPGAG